MLEVLLVMAIGGLSSKPNAAWVIPGPLPHLPAAAWPRITVVIDGALEVFAHAIPIAGLYGLGGLSPSTSFFEIQASGQAIFCDVSTTKPFRESQSQTKVRFGP